MEGLCNHIKGAYVQNGHGTLTNKRFIYSKHSIGKIFTIGLLVNLTKGDYEFDIPIENIEQAWETKRFLSKILVVRTKDGEEYKFGVTKLVEWLMHFNNLLNSINVEKTDVEISSADEIMKFKQLLDAGAITQEEYESKKKQLLDL